MKPRKPIKRTGIRYKPPTDHAERIEVVRRVHERDVHCRAMWSVAGVACVGPLDVHELLPRGRGGDWLDVNNCVLLCRAHHDWVHAHPIEAVEVGLLRKSS